MNHFAARSFRILAAFVLVFVFQFSAMAQIPPANQQPFDLDVVSSGRIDPPRVLEMMDMSLFNPATSMELERQDHENEPRETRNRNGGSRSGGGSTVISGGSTSFGTFRDPDQPEPNYQIEVALSRNRSMTPLKDTIAYFLTEYELIDDQGNVIECDVQQGTFQAPKFEQSDHENSRFLYVHVPEQARLIKSIKGHLIVSDGYSFEAYVRADQLSGKVRKQTGNQFIEFETVANRNNQLNMNVAFTIPSSRVKPPGSLREMKNNNIEERMQLMMWEQFNRMVTVIAMGDDKRVYAPARLGAAGAGGLATGDGTGDGTGGGTGNGSGTGPGNLGGGQPPGKGNRRPPGRRSSNAPGVQPTAGIAVSFEFPEGVRPVAVKCIVHQRTSEIEGFPFELTDIEVNNRERGTSQ